METYINSPKWISDTVAASIQYLKIESLSVEGDTNPVRSHYSQEDKAVRIDSKKENDPEEYKLTLLHEVGHFVDDNCGRISSLENFEFAITADKDQYSKSNEIGTMNFRRLLNDLAANTEVISDRYVSDILSALFLNDIEVRACYWDNFMPYYKHKLEYWTEMDGPDDAIQREIFANLFAIYTENKSRVVGFIENNFPNITNRFKKEITEYERH